MSNKLRFFVNGYFFTFFTISVAMQNIGVTKIQNITELKNPYSVHYITNNIIAIKNITQFCMLNLITNKAQYTPDRTGQIRGNGNTIIQSDDEKIILANDRNLMIIDQKEKICDSFGCPPITSLKIGSSNNFWCTTNETDCLLRCDYNTIRVFKQPISCHRIIDLDEEKRTIYVEDHDENISVYHLDNYQKYETIKIPKRTYKEIKNLRCQLSPDKSYLAFGNESFIYKTIINNSLYCESFIKSSSNEQFKRMAFLPYQNILATVSQISDIKSIVQYWDFAQVEAKDPLYMLELDGLDCRDISFAPNGTEVIIAFRDKCIRASVPFSII